MVLKLLVMCIAVTALVCVLYLPSNHLPFDRNTLLIHRKETHALHQKQQEEVQNSHHKETQGSHLSKMHPRRVFKYAAKLELEEGYEDELDENDLESDSSETLNGRKYVKSESVQSRQNGVHVWQVKDSFHPQDGVDINNYEKDEIIIEPEIRNELWPTTTTRRPLTYRRIAKTEAPSAQQQSSGTSRIYADSIGTLGDQLFEFASLYGISRALSTHPEAYLSPHSILTALFSNITIGSDKLGSSVSVYMEDGAGIYSPALYRSQPGSFGICCYLQSWRYFHNLKSDIRAQLQFKPSYENAAKLIIDKLKEQFMTDLKQVPQNDMLNDSPVNRKKPEDYFNSLELFNYTKGFHVTMIGMHVSRPRKSKVSKPDHRSAPREYFERAMQYFRKIYSDALFFVVSSDKQWCRDSLTTSYGDVMFVKQYGDESAVALAILSQMKHSIISQGAFSWWAGWLAGGDVIYYPNWIDEKKKSGLAYKLKDHYPPWWLSISVDVTDDDKT